MNANQDNQTANAIGVGSSDVLCHDHICHCGTATHTPHEIGKDGCVRTMTAAPRKVSCEEDRWMVDGHNITGYSMREQRGYHQHPCGCWSRSPGSTNSIEA